MKFKAVIFDLDGTLIDSEQHWVVAEQQFLGKHNITPKPGYVALFHGRSMREVVTMLKEEHNLVATIEQLLADKTESSDAIYTTMSLPIAGANKLLKQLHNAQARMAIASGSTLPRIQTIVDRFGWQPYFELLASVDDVDYRGKPDPAVFCYAVEKMNLKPEDCVVVEDSVNGVVAAKGANITCIALTKQGWSDGDYSAADIQVPSLEAPELYSYLGL